MEYPCIEKNFRDFQRLGSTIRRDGKIQKYVNEEYGNVFFLSFYKFSLELLQYSKFFDIILHIRFYFS